MSLATFSNRLFGTIMASTLLSMTNALSWAGYFLLLSFVCLLSATFLYFIVPETKGRSLEDMSLYFAEITNDRSILDIKDAPIVVSHNIDILCSNNKKDSMHAFS